MSIANNTIWGISIKKQSDLRKDYNVWKKIKNSKNKKRAL